MRERAAGVPGKAHFCTPSLKAELANSKARPDFLTPPAALLFSAHTDNWAQSLHSELVFRGALGTMESGRGRRGRLLRLLWAALAPGGAPSSSSCEDPRAALLSLLAGTGYRAPVVRGSTDAHMPWHRSSHRNWCTLRRAVALLGVTP